MQGTWYRIGVLEELATGEVSTHALGERELAVCRTPEGVFVIEDRCPHAEARMSEGRLRGCRITCPMHGASFDVRDGSVHRGPAREPLHTFPVRVESGMVEVLIPGPAAGAAGDPTPAAGR